MATLLYRLGLGAARRPLLVILAWVLALALAVALLTGCGHRPQCPGTIASCVTFAAPQQQAVTR